MVLRKLLDLILHPFVCEPGSITTTYETVVKLTGLLTAERVI